jgi:hypothetical protein
MRPWATIGMVATDGEAASAYTQFTGLPISQTMRSIIYSFVMIFRQKIQKNQHKQNNSGKQNQRGSKIKDSHSSVAVPST